MKNLLFIVAIISIIMMDACKEEHNPAMIPTYTPTADNYSSMSDFFVKNASPMQTYTVDAIAGGSFTTPQGTNVTVGTNSFVDQNGNPITSGSVTIEFKDIYKKSDMLLNNISTTYTDGRAMKSGGEFFIRAKQGIINLQLTPNHPIVVKQPFNGFAKDTGMKAMILPELPGWIPAPRDSFNNPIDSLNFSLSNYVFNLYKFNNPIVAGSWCNSDNANFFSAYTHTLLTLNPTDSVTVFGTNVFLVFKNLNSMVHVYWDPYNIETFPYNYAPQGLQCTVVSVGTKDGKVYSSFTPITIGANQTVNFTLSETTMDKFKAALKALD